MNRSTDSVSGAEGIRGAATVLPDSRDGHHEPWLGQWFACIVFVVLMLHLGLLLYGSWIHSPNDLEVNVIPAGYVHLRYGRFDIAQVNPPFSRTLCALPLLGFEIDEDWESFRNRADLRIEYEYGYDFLRRNAARLQVMFFASRSVAALFSLLGAVSILLIACRLYDRNAGLASLLVWCFCPMILGHGATANHDMPGAALLAATFLAFLEFREHAGCLQAILLGLASGLTILTRTTCVPVIGLLLLAFLLTPCRAHQAFRWLHRGLVAAIVAMAVIVLNGGYGFSGTWNRLGDYEFFSFALAGQHAPRGNRFRETALTGLPVPLPRDFVQGLDLQQKDFEAPPFDSYLLGQWSRRGWWYYYLVGWAVKTPIGFQGLTIGGIVALARRWWRGKAALPELLVLLGAGMIFAMVSIQYGFTIHYRYVLPAWPFLAVLSGSVLSMGTMSRRSRSAFALLLIVGITESLSAYPNQIAFFNGWASRLGGGPYFLLHSSCDWGQDVYKAADWYREAKEKTGDRVYLLTYGVVTPHMLGVSTVPVPSRASKSYHRRFDEAETRPGKYAISVAHLFANHGRYAYLMGMKPVGDIGTTIRVYELSSSDIARLQLNDVD
ncbi:MAG: glycosyltransferase family 39 protein [Planctomycetes bacterium]|nr:glycosyltransferase family 39 protein [Planctomycetota bacterium]